MRNRRFEFRHGQSTNGGTRGNVFRKSSIPGARKNGSKINGGIHKEHLTIRKIHIIPKYKHVMISIVLRLSCVNSRIYIICVLSMRKTPIEDCICGLFSQTLGSKAAPPLTTVEREMVEYFGIIDHRDAGFLFIYIELDKQNSKTLNKSS